MRSVSFQEVIEATVSLIVKEKSPYQVILDPGSETPGLGRFSLARHNTKIFSN